MVNLPRVRSAITRPSHATVIAYLALFVALGGASYAVSTAPKNSVTSKSIKRGAVKSPDVRDRGLTGDDIADESLGGSKIAGDAIGGSEVADGSLGGAEIGDGSLGSAEIGDDSLTGADILESSLGLDDLSRGRSFTEATNNACNPASATKVTCASVTLPLDRTSRVLVIADAQAFAIVGGAEGGGVQSHGGRRGVARG